MAPGASRPCYSPCWNLLPIDFMKDELARDPGLVRGPHSSTTSLALSRNPAPGPTLVPALILALASVLVFTNKLFKQFMKAYLELNQLSR